MTRPFARALLLFVAFLPLAALPARAVNWTNQGYSAGIDGFNPHETTISASNVQNLSLAWTSNTSDINGDYAMVEDKGTIFVSSSDQNGNGDIVALNGSTGAELWKAGDDYANGIAAGSGLVFSDCLDDGNADDEGLCAFDQKTGEQKWFVFFACQCEYGAAISRPTYDSGAVYVEYDGYSYDENLVKLDAKTGAVLWSTQIGQDNEFFGTNSGSAVADGTVYEACQQVVDYQETVNGLCAVSTSTGAVVWTYSGNGTNYDQGAVSVSGKTVFYAQVLNANGTPMSLNALNAQTGTVLWTSTGNQGAEGQNWFVQPTIAKGGVYWLDNANTLSALESRKGSTDWSTSNWGSFCSQNSGSSQPQFVNGVVFAIASCSDLGANYVTIFALDANSGNVLWQDAEGSHQQSGASPMVIDGILYSDCYEVCAYDLSGGAARRPSKR